MGTLLSLAGISALHDVHAYDRAIEIDKDIAVKDSDLDGFSNGLELGDEDGDGIPEIGIERSNPGDPLNTPSSVDRETWGLIKSLFED